MSISASPASAPATVSPRARRPPPPRRALPAPLARLLLLAVALGASAIACHLLSHELTDDSYAFLDWGRDLRHGIFPPQLESRTFHPIPILTGALLSLLGSSGPSVTVFLAVAGLVLLAVAAWQVSVLVGLAQPAPAFAALLIVTSPMLVAISFGAYINLPFAVLEMWALVWELRGRSRPAWALLVIAGLVRPEGWAFLLSYGALEWWRAGRPLFSRRLLAIVVLTAGPMTAWLSLEWRLFGSPLYSFTNTTTPAGTVATSASLHGLWSTLEFCLALPILVASALGVVVVLRTCPRRMAWTLLGATGVAALTVAFLAKSKFNVPDRHFSAFVSFLCVLAAAGATAPAQWLAHRRPRGRARDRRRRLGLGLAGCALVVALAASTARQKLEFDFDVFRLQAVTGAQLDAAIDRIRPRVDVRDAAPAAVEAAGAVVDSELVYDLRIPYGVVVSAPTPQTKLLVEPSRKTWSRLFHRGLTDRHVVSVPHRWTIVTGGTWPVYSPQVGRPVQLGR